MIHTEEQLTADVMRRVKTIHVVCHSWGPLLVKGAVCVGCLTVSGVFFVSIPNVAENMSHLSGFFQYTSYMFNSLLRTDLTVQLLSVGVLGMGVWGAKDMYSSIRTRTTRTRSTLVTA